MAVARSRGSPSCVISSQDIPRDSLMWNSPIPRASTPPRPSMKASSRDDRSKSYQKEPTDQESPRPTGPPEALGGAEGVAVGPGLWGPLGDISHEEGESSVGVTGEDVPVSTALTDLENSVVRLSVASDVTDLIVEPI